MPRFIILLIMIVAAARVGRADEAIVEPRLDAKAAILQKLNALKPNQAAILGKADVIGDFNETARRFDLPKTGPQGRDFTIKMCWALDRKRALYCGANHGVPHRLNDVWEFDLPSLTWAMLYAPDNARGYVDLGKDFSDVEFKDGILITKRGGPAVVGHTWWGLTYDPTHKALLFMDTWVTDRKKAIEALGGNPAELYEGPPLWAFYPAERRWQPLKAERPYPRPIFGGMLEFVPDLGGSIWHANNWQMHGSWLYDASRNSWKDLKPNGASSDFEKQSPAPEQVGYYDSARKLIIVHRDHDTFHFDPQKLQWKQVLAGAKDDGKTPFGHDARSPMHYDPTSGQGLLVQFETNQLWSYDPDKVAWTKLTPEGDAMPTGNKRLAYVDQAQNALVVIDGVTVWAYRFRAR